MAQLETCPTCSQPVNPGIEVDRSGLYISDEHPMAEPRAWVVIYRNSMMGHLASNFVHSTMEDAVRDAKKVSLEYRPVVKALR